MDTRPDPSPQAKKPKHLPWLLKYRPRQLQEIVGNESIISRLASISEKGYLPHLILAGPPGCGKTSAIHCLSNDLLRDENGKSVKSKALLELNASDDRGLSVVRNQIKSFCTKKVNLRKGIYKIVFLDEVDSMTSGAQQSLRRLMEQHEDSTRFCFACNISSKIIEPLQSRCVILRFSRVTDEQMVSRIKYILNKENADYDDAGLRALVLTADGDMRQLINNAQTTVSGFGKVTESNVYKVCDRPHPAKIHKCLISATKGDIDSCLNIIGELWSLGYSSLDILTSFFRIAKYLTPTEISEYMQMEFIKLIGLAQMDAVNGLTTLLQLQALVSKMCAFSDK